MPSSTMLQSKWIRPPKAITQWAPACFGLVVFVAPMASGADETASLSIPTVAAISHPSCTGVTHEIRVQIKNVKKNTGVISADLYPNEDEKFLKGRMRLERVIVAAKSPMTELCISAPSVDQYAVSVYHDLNANGDFDKGAFGIPVEPWGLSNNPKTGFKAPPVEKTLFAVDEAGADIEIKLRLR